MRHLPLLFGLVLVAGLLVHDLYEFVVTNEGIRYYSAKPARLLYVMLLAVAGGLLALGIGRLSPAAQRKLQLLALGGLGTLLVAGVAMFGYFLCRLALAVPHEGLEGAGISCGMGLAAMTAGASVVWIEFRRVWKRVRP